MLTTKDNPYNPITQYDAWLDWDRTNGYYTNELLARFIPLSADMSEEDTMGIIDEAMQTIVDSDLTENYMIVKA